MGGTESTQQQSYEFVSSTATASPAEELQMASRRPLSTLPTTTGTTSSMVVPREPEATEWCWQTVWRNLQEANERIAEEERRREAARAAREAERLRIETQRREERIRQEQAARIERERVQAEMERQRVEAARKQAEEKRIRTLSIKLIDCIDRFIRTRSRFDSSQPAVYRCGLSSITQDRDVLAALQETQTIPVLARLTLQQFIELRQNEFKVHGDTRNTNNVSISVARLTPGSSDRMFGSYQCSSCRRKWMSSWSWTDKYQMCNGCNRQCYPYSREELRGGSGSNDQKPHDHSRCQKCKEVGDCTRLGRR
jgi:hypothetical protein